MQVIRQPARARTLHQRAPQSASLAAEQHGNFGECAGILLLTPGPITMQVDIVVSEPLLEGQARAERVMAGLGDAARLEAEWREQFPQPPYLVFVSGRGPFEPPARDRNFRCRRDRG